MIIFVYIEAAIFTPWNSVYMGACLGHYGIVINYVQMLPLIKKSTDNLVDVIGEKVASEESFEVLKYVRVLRQTNVQKVCP